MSQLWNRLIGFMVIFIGISIVVNIIGFGYQFLGALFLFGIGIILYRHVHHWVGIFTLALAVITLFTNVFQINIAGVLVAAVFIYIGYCFLTGREVPFLKRSKREKRYREKNRRRRRRKRKRGREKAEEDSDIDGDWLDDEIDALKEENQRKKRSPCDDDPADIRLKTPKFRNPIVGDLHLLNARFELEDLNLSSGIGDVKIDLSKAIIPEGESTIVISSLIGDVDIYVPYDLNVTVAGSVTFGELKILGHKQGGINRQLNMATSGYEQADRKVKISVSIFIGDIDVRHL